MELSDRLFETAVNDLNSVELLYNSNYYSLALFQLQQAIEKLVKSFGIRTGTIKPEEMTKGIGHFPHKVFTQLYQHQIEDLSKQYKTPLFLADMVPPHQRGKNKIKENINKTQELHSQIIKIHNNSDKDNSVEEIELFIEGAEKLEKEPIFNNEELFKEFKEDFVKTNEHFIEYFKHDENIRSLSEEFIQKSNEITINRITEYKQSKIRERKFGYISYVWINLSLVTSSHEQSTRYPSMKNDDTPMKVYDNNHLIIKYIPIFLEMLTKTIVKYKEVYNE
jgi:HEPN domain